MLAIGIDAGKHLGVAVLEVLGGAMQCRAAMLHTVHDPWSLDWPTDLARELFSVPEFAARQDACFCVELPKATYPGKAASSSLTKALIEASVAGMVCAKHFDASLITTAADVRRMFCGSPSANDADVQRALRALRITLPTGANNTHTRDAALAAAYLIRRHHRREKP